MSKVWSYVFGLGFIVQNFRVDDFSCIQQCSFVFLDVFVFVSFVVNILLCCVYYDLVTIGCSCPGRRLLVLNHRSVRGYIIVRRASALSNNSVRPLYAVAGSLAYLQVRLDSPQMIASKVDAMEGLEMPNVKPES